MDCFVIAFAFSMGIELRFCLIEASLCYEEMGTVEAEAPDDERMHVGNSRSLGS